MFDIVLNAIKAVFQWIIDQVAALGQTVISWVVSIIPGVDTSGNSNFIGALNAANAWVPLDAGTALIITYFAFITSWLLIKIIIKLIP